MTVKELIAELEKMPPEATVDILSTDSYSHLSKVEIWPGEPVVLLSDM